MSIAPMERSIETILDLKLRDAGWEDDPRKNNVNVFKQQPRTYSEKELLGTLRPDYCLYLNRESSHPDIIIETKRPGKNLQQAFEQAYTYAKLLNSPLIIVFDGITFKQFHTETKKELKINELSLGDLLSPDKYQLFIDHNSSDISTVSKLKIQSKTDLINVFSFANEKLRKAGITKGIERFTEFSNILFLKLISENNETFTTLIPSHVKWNAYKDNEGQQLLSYINNTVIPELAKIYGNTAIFSPLIIKDTLALKEIIQKLDGLDLTSVETDIKGDAFEYLIQKYNSNNKDLGEYFTPRHIVKFLITLADPKYRETVYDPFCGTGGMLICAFNHIYFDCYKKGILSDSVKQDLREKTIYGSEISSTAKIAKMNMILTGDGHSNILQQDTLKSPVSGKYDVIVSNIPFNLTVDPSSFYYTLGSKNGNIQCLEHIIMAMKDTGRAYIIVPESVLNNKELYNTRKYIIENNLLAGIISLPSGVFLPYTGAKTSILVLQGTSRPHTKKCFYHKIGNDGFTLTSRRRKKDGINDLDEFLSMDKENLSYIDYDDIKKSENYSFLYFKYNTKIPEGFILLKDVIKEEKNKNSDQFQTATVSNTSFWGIESGEDYWGENFDSVTSKSNSDYKVIRNRYIAYNPSRINVGSIGINTQPIPVAVSKMYVVFSIKNQDFLPEFVYLYLKTNKDAHDEISTRSFGSVRNTLRFEDLITIPIPKLSIDEQKKIIQKANDCFIKYSEYKDKLDKFEAIAK